MRIRIIEQRTKLGLTQTKLSTITGISQSMISKVENNERGLDDRSKVKIAHALGVTVGWLFFNEDYDETPLKEDCDRRKDATKSA